MKKRIVALVCVLTMLLSLLPTTALAEGPDFTLGLSATATVGTTSEARPLSELRPGDIVTVKIIVPGGFEFVAAQVKLLFDKDRFELTKKAVSGLVPTKTETTAGWDSVVTTQVSIANANGYVSTTGAGATLNEYEEVVTGNYSMPVDWDILTVTLKVKNDAPVGTASFAISTESGTLKFAHEVGAIGSSVTTAYNVGVDDAISATVVQELSAVEVSGSLTTPTKGGTDFSEYTSTNPNVDVAVSWDPALVGGKFASNTVYTATVTVTPKTGYIWASDAAVTDTSDSGLTAFTKSGNSFVATKKFDKTADKSLTGLVITDCNVSGKTAGDTLGTSNLTVKATYDDGSEDANYTGYEVVYAHGTALKLGDTSVQVKSGEIVSAAANFDAIPGKTAEAGLFTFNAPALTYSGADQIDAVKSAAALKSAYADMIGAPTITVKQGDTVVTEAKNAGSYDVYVSCAAGTVYDAVSDLMLGTVTISKADQAALTISCSNTVEFGSTLALTTTGGTTGGDVTYAVEAGGTGEATISGNTLTPTRVGTVKVTATMAGNDNYNPVTSAEFTVTITQKAITGATVTLAKESEEYTGSPIEVAVSSVVLGGVTLTTDDYDVSYKNNTNVGTATVTVTGKGNYTGTATKSFEITKADAPTDVKATFNVYYGNQNVQTVAPDNFNLPADIKNPRFKGTAGTASGDDILESHSNDSFQLKAGVSQGKTASWTVTIESDNYEDIKDAAVTVTTVDVVFKVGDATASADNAVTLASNKTYGQTWKNLVTVNSGIVAWLDGEEVEGTFALNKTDSDIPGAGDHTYNVIFTSTDGKYTNIPVFATDASITVEKRPVTVTVTPVSVAYNAEIPTFNATVTSGSLVGSDTVDSLKLNLTTTATKGDAPGNYHVTGDSDGNHNYTVTIEGTGKLTITKANATVGAPTPKTLTYTGNEQELVNAGSTTGGTLQYSLSENAGFSTEIPKGTDAKKYDVWYKVVGGDNYNDTTPAKVEVTISAKNVGDDDVTIAAISDETYTGEAKAPDLTVKFGEKSLVKDTDYTVKYTDNVNAGTATSTITGTGNYTGTTTKNFTISKAAAKTLADKKVAHKYTLDGEQTVSVAGLVEGATKYTMGTATGTTGIVSAYSVGADGVVKYTLTGTGAATQSVTLPVTIESTNYADSTVKVVITLTEKDPQAALTINSGTTVTYGQTLTLSTTGGSGTGAVSYSVTNGTGEATVSGNVLTPVKAGTVTVTATKASDADYNEVTSEAVTITINKATPTGQPAYTKITTSGKTLADAALDKGTITIPGTIQWVDAEGNPLDGTTAVTANTAYRWVFTPNDTDNYETLTGSITPYVVHSSSGGSGSSSYSITVESDKNGTVTVSPKSARKGTTVTITVKPDEGFELDTLRVYDKDGNKIKVTEGKNGKYTFTMPASKVTVKAAFEEIESAWPFVDVAEDFWARDAIAWAYENGYMNGNSATTFNPGGSVTRQQLWMILARLSGERPASMAEAKVWAVENGISDGSNPGNAVSRQQMVTILYRYAHLMGYKTSGSAALDIFPDSAKVAPYAQDAMAWSVANGIVGGTTQGTLNPGGTANRAQFATILQRFCKNIVED